MKTKSHIIILIFIVIIYSCKRRDAESVSEIVAQEEIAYPPEEIVEDIEVYNTYQLKSAISGRNYEREKITMTESDKWILGRWIGYIEGQKIILGFEEDRYILNDEYEGSYIIDYYATWDNLTCRGDRNYNLYINRNDKKLKLKEYGNQYILEKASNNATDKTNDFEIEKKYELLGEWVHITHQEWGDEIDHTLVLEDNGFANYRPCHDDCGYNGEYTINNNYVYFKGEGIVAKFSIKEKSLLTESGVELTKEEQNQPQKEDFEYTYEEINIFNVEKGKNCLLNRGFEYRQGRDAYTWNFSQKNNSRNKIKATVIVYTIPNNPNINTYIEVSRGYYEFEYIETNTLNVVEFKKTQGNGPDVNIRVIDCGNIIAIFPNNKAVRLNQR
ncbi:hypothetical protein [Dysgonomonas sp. 521]|uniref:hypothetical protein n=1 Tax=Dysgonomonas sp. 521 TaxID=2302932 RepID=UPI0013D6D985|nr:hypothetical protein [Dysgonomonas sp. 521]